MTGAELAARALRDQDVSNNADSVGMSPRLR
jgi:hypothetical protein